MNIDEDRIYLVEGSYYRENSFLMAYTKEEIEWIRNGGKAPEEIIEAMSPDSGMDLSPEWIEGLCTRTDNEAIAERISATVEISYLGDYRSLNTSLTGYIWTEFTHVGLI